MGHYRSEMMSVEEERQERMWNLLHMATTEFQAKMSKKLIADIIVKMEVAQYMAFMRLMGTQVGNVCISTFRSYSSPSEDFELVLPVLCLTLPAFDDWKALKKEDEDARAARAARRR